MSKKNRREKQFQSIKKNRIVGSVIRFGITALVMLFCMMIALNLAASQILNTKIYEYQRQYQTLAALYEKNGTEDGKTKEFVSSLCPDHYILDQNGKVLYHQGRIVSIMHQENLTLLMAGTQYDVYLDGDYAWLRYNGENKYYEPDYGEMFWRILVGEDAENMIEQVNGENSDGQGEISFDVTYGQAEVAINATGFGTFQFPLWLAIPMKDGQEVFLGRTNLEIEKQTGILIIGFVIIAALLWFLLLGFMLINLIVIIVRQRKTIDTFLTDPITKGHNGSCFFMRQGPALQKKHANQNIAIVSLLFLNYRTFCTCHSLEEGEEMLRSICQTVAKKLGKKESCSHVTTSNYAIVLFYEDEKQLRKRLKELIGDLENIDPSHKFAFHAGVKLLEIRRKANGKPEKRRNLNIEKEYNDASTARATLADSDESRIAFFDEKLIDEQKWVDSVQEHQKQAIEKEEFVIYYQPKYDPKTQKLRGAEALIRWDSPELGFVSPGRFIPIFEKNGFITEIDHFMISHVARDQKAWLDQGYTCVPVSVNVSRAHFIESDLAEQIRDSVDKAGAPHDLIEIELTESAFFDDKNAMIKTILKLKEYGFMVSMDDFGSGYSSLNSLKDMPLDVLKLDAEFFRGEKEGGRGEIVVAEAIKLAKNLDMHTVAEGVEERDQVDFLAKQGCDMIQGYYFARPMARDAYEDAMKKGFSDKGLESEESAEEVREEPAAEETVEIETAVEVPAEEKNEEADDGEVRHDEGACEEQGSEEQDD